ncbi:MAG: hypothetical protein H6Q19_80 [Bacteroidetes bacterium]|nr:hypothetical protein [Bacteroidota bacterium]
MPMTVKFVASLCKFDTDSKFINEIVGINIRIID